MCNSRHRYVLYSFASMFLFYETSPQTAAQASLVLHKKELEAGHAMDVFMSNPERKKERTDQSADEKELYVAGLSKFTTKVDLEKVFKTVRSLHSSITNLVKLMERDSMVLSRRFDLRQIRMANAKGSHLWSLMIL